MNKITVKDCWYGLLHVLVALSAILFVCGTTGINLPLSFLTIGIGTLIFHLFTKNKLAVLMGVSGSYIGGMAIVGAEYGAAYVAGGVVLAGLIYLLAGLVIKSKPQLYDKFPKYILNTAVLLIALNLLPIGAGMVGGNVVIAAITVAVGFVLFASKRFAAWAFPGALVTGTVLAGLTQNISVATEVTKLAFTTPAFNLASFTLIGVVALAVVFESLGDSANCANAQGIELDGSDFGGILLGNGTASVVSGALGGLPLTSYSENVGFIYLTNYKRPNAQIVASIIFIIMAFVPGIATIFSIIPGFVYGAMLLFLFAIIGSNAVKNIGGDLEGNKMLVFTIMLATFFICPSSLFSPIAAAIIVGGIVHAILGRSK